MKRFSAFCFTVIIACLSSFGAFAATESGTYEKGIDVKSYAIYSLDPVPEFKNGDFSEGFKFWGAMLEGGPSVNAKLVTRDGNTYMQLAPVREYGGVISLKFICNDFVPGDRAVVIYDWKGSDSHQVYLTQDIGNGLRIGNGPDELIKEAADKDGWNTSITRVTGTVEAPSDGNENLVFYIGAQALTNLSSDTCFDNIRLGRLGTDGKVFDLKGNEVGISEQVSKNTQSNGQKTQAQVSDESKPDTSSEQESSGLKISKNTVIIIILCVFAAAFVAFDILLFVRIIRHKKNSK